MTISSMRRMLIFSLLIALAGCVPSQSSPAAPPDGRRSAAADASAPADLVAPLTAPSPVPPAVDRLPESAPWVFVWPGDGMSEGDETVLAPEGAVLALDGQSLLRFPVRLKNVFARPGRTPLLLETREHPLTFIVVDPATGARIDTGIPAGHGLHGHAFSPDQSQLALLFYQRPRSRLIVVDLAAGSAQQMLDFQPPRLRQTRLAGWRDEGLYLTSSLSQSVQLWRLDSSGLKAPEPHAELPSSYFQLSQDMSTLFFAEHALKVVDLRSGRQEIIADERDYTMAARPPHDMTADGSRLAYIQEPRPDGNCRLVIYEKLSGNSLHLDAGPSLCDHLVAWSSDGERLLLFGWEKDARTAAATGRLGLKLYTPDGQALGDAVLVGVPFSIAGRPHLTGDDHVVALIEDPEGVRLVSTDLQGSPPRQLGPELPAGSWLIYLPDER